MVTFTCNNCGDSVKKNRVEKHSSFECRRKSGGPNVCCIDCLKDFRQDYEAHTSCQTEDERYSAKGTFVAKEAKNKQQKKQLTWSEIIQSVADTHANLNQSSKDILDIIKESDNNFCKNNSHLRRFSDKEILAVFNLVQEEMKKNVEAANQEKQQALAAAKEKKETEQPTAKKRSISETSEGDEKVQSKKIKTNQESEQEENNKGKKKKNKKNKTNDTHVDMEVKQNGTANGVVEPMEDTNQTNGEVGKKKKKKNKNSQATSTETDVAQDIVEDTKKLNGVQSNGIKESSDEKLTNGDKKKKKKKNEQSSSQDNKEVSEVKPEPADVSVVEEMNDSTVSTKSPKKKRKSNEPEKTPFKDIIAKLLKPGTEIKLKSLKKMVFAVYKSGEEEVPREVRENFNKKLLKIPNVQMNEKMVKLVK
ncbi:hypothetical protein M8J76_016883 [Diaphorina citri]|nr:hypothetical protein M8J76_016883 [Diaphorina citri]